MKIESTLIFCLAVFTGACAMARSVDHPWRFLIASCVTLLATAVMLSIQYLLGLFKDRSCR